MHWGKKALSVSFLLGIVFLCNTTGQGTITLGDFDSNEKNISWDPVTRTHTLTGNLNKGIVLVASDITLDGKGYKISGGNSGFGVYMNYPTQYSTYTNVVIKNLVVSGFHASIYLHRVVNSRFENNELYRANLGFYVWNTDESVFKGNYVHHSRQGINLFSGSDNNVVTENVVTDQEYIGISIDYGGNYNRVFNNDVMDNRDGIWIVRSDYNEIYNNNFIDNYRRQVYVLDKYGRRWFENNKFYKELPVGGNYWSDWREPDEEAPFGIVDNPYRIYEQYTENRDLYPWANPDGWQSDPGGGGSFDDLIAEVKNSGLNRGNMNALLKKLLNARRAYQRGALEAARGLLGAFINQVSTFVESGKLSFSQGEEWASMANNIMDSFGENLIEKSKTDRLASEETTFDLKQNYPNPFNPSTEIIFFIPDEQQVKIVLYNSLGSEVAVLVDEVKGEGIHRIKFDGSDLASGLYIYRLITPVKILSQKMLLVK